MTQPPMGPPPMASAPMGPPPSGRPRPVMSRGRLIVGGIIVVGLIIAAIIGHAIESKSSIAVGDCVQTTPSVTSGWDITKVSCNQQYGLGTSTYQVQTVLDGSNQTCYGDSETTFNDDPAGKTYCLVPWMGPNQ
jgi:hypothetical protein